MNKENKICKCGALEIFHPIRTGCKKFELLITDKMGQNCKSCGNENIFVRGEDRSHCLKCGKKFEPQEVVAHQNNLNPTTKNHSPSEDNLDSSNVFASSGGNSPQERKKEYNKEYYQENKELHRRIREKKLKENPNYDKEKYYNKKDKDYYKKSHRKANIKYDKKNPEKLRARTLAQTHIKLEGLCEKCQVRPAEHRHHPDYTKPLFVKLLCHKCHREIHKNGE